MSALAVWQGLTELSGAALNYWLNTGLFTAFLCAFAVHGFIYLAGSSAGMWITESLFPALGWGRPQDQHPPKAGQIRREIINGLVACLILALASLSYRWLCRGIWPESWLQAGLQIGCFVVFNNVYSYTTHRLLHSRPLARFHRVHHKSVRVTPFSSYSVHPVEAVVIAATLPVFMCFVPLGVGTALVLHVVGMVYTTCIHCNYDWMPALSDQHWMKKLINHPAYHRYHHTLGNVNYGFTNRMMDLLFRTSRG